MPLRIQDFYFAQTVNAQNPPQIVEEGYSQNLSKVRYVGGMCVGRILASYTSYLCEHCHEDTELVKTRKAVVRALQARLYNTITIAKQESQCPDTLNEICHRQYKYGHLTVVDDGLFEMFVPMGSIVHTLLSMNTWFQER